MYCEYHLSGALENAAKRCYFPISQLFVVQPLPWSYF